MCTHCTAVEADYAPAKAAWPARHSTPDPAAILHQLAATYADELRDAINTGAYEDAIELAARTHKALEQHQYLPGWMRPGE